MWLLFWWVKLKLKNDAERWQRPVAALPKRAIQWLNVFLLRILLRTLQGQLYVARKITIASCMREIFLIIHSRNLLPEKIKISRSGQRPIYFGQKFLSDWVQQSEENFGHIFQFPSSYKNSSNFKALAQEVNFSQRES